MEPAEQSTGDESRLTSSRLVSGLRSRDPQAWERLCRLCQPLIEGWCRRCGVREADTPDIVQEVFRGVATGIDAFRLDRPDATFRGWLYGIAQHKLRDHWARQAAEPPGEGGSAALDRLAMLPESGQTTGSWEPNGDRNILLNQALRIVRQDFRDDTWKAFWAMAIEGRPASDVAQELGMTTLAVRQAKYRVLHRLRDEFGPLLD